MGIKRCVSPVVMAVKLKKAIVQIRHAEIFRSFLFLSDEIEIGTHVMSA